jgi:hypothetical protein
MGRIPGVTPSKSVMERGLKHLRPIHKTIAWMLATGSRQCDIAKELGFNQSRLSLIVNSPLFKEELEKAERERDEVFMNHGLKEIKIELGMWKRVLNVWAKSLR